MKKLLSILLAVCMVTAFFSATSVSAVENPATYTYKLGQANDVGGLVPVPNVTDYVAKGGTNGEWKYYGMDDSLIALQASNPRQVEINQSYGAYMTLGFTTVGQYIQLMVKVPKNGTYYEPTVNCASGSNSTNIDMYVAPKNASNPMERKYFVGGFNPKNAATTLGAFAADSGESEYIITFVDATNSNGHDARVLTLVFKETEAPKVEYTYDFGWSQETNAVREVPDVTEYVAKSGTNGQWKYYGMSEGFAYLHNNTLSGTLKRTFEVTQPNNYMNISFNAPGQYASLMIEVPKTDTYYTPEFTYRSGSGSNAIKVYIAPKTAANPRAKEYLKGIFNAYEKYSTGDTVTLETFKSDAAETEYILTFENASTGSGNNLGAISLVLSETEETAIQPVNEQYAFNFVHATAGVGIPTLDTYANTLRNWKYCNMESSLKASYEAGTSVARTLAGCLNIVPVNSNGQWLSLTFDNLSKGTYDIDFGYATHKNGGIGDVYLAPATVSENERTNAEYKIGTIDYFETDAAYKTGYTAKLLKTTLEEDGDYVITFKHTGEKNPSAAGYQMNPVNLRLTETTPDAISGDTPDSLASVTILAEIGGAVSVEGDYEVVDEVKVGTKITATATADNGYTFAYWRNAAGKWLSSEETETFTVNTNTGVVAVFEKIPEESDAEASVYFYNGNGNLIETKKVTKGSTFGSVKIENPSLTGFVFDKWSVDNNAIINALTRAVALYNDSEEVYTVKVGDNVVASDKKYEEVVTVTSSDNNFSYWMIGDDIVSYDKSFSFRVYGDVTLTEVCEGAKKAQPTVALDVIGDDYFLGYTTPAGYEKIEAGILFSKSGTPTVGNFYSKATEKTGSGQFTAKSSGDGETVARGYLIFKNPDGNIRVMYTD